MTKTENTTKTENITEAIKGTLNTSYGRIFLISALLGPFYVIALLWIARRLLTPEDAEFFRAACSAALTLVVGGSGGTTFWSGLMKTKAKIDAQLTPGIATAATPLGEAAAQLTPVATAILAGDSKGAQVALQTAGINVAADELQRRTGLDIRDFNIGAPTSAPRPLFDLGEGSPTLAPEGVAPSPAALLSGGV